ncbi:unnamed protein product [Xylocopa violacea]|uniref:Uncharacterized protein n=1 Tax=Xylocopa violacea TaxID=135666 RepID=A0ABP1MZ17_XYLVO
MSFPFCLCRAGDWARCLASATSLLLSIEGLELRTKEHSSCLNWSIVDCVWGLSSWLELIVEAMAFRKGFWSNLDTSILGIFSYSNFCWLASLLSFLLDSVGLEICLTLFLFTSNWLASFFSSFFFLLHSSFAKNLMNLFLCSLLGAFSRLEAFSRKAPESSVWPYSSLLRSDSEDFTKRLSGEFVLRSSSERFLSNLPTRLLRLFLRSSLDSWSS